MQNIPIDTKTPQRIHFLVILSHALHAGRVSTCFACTAKALPLDKIERQVIRIILFIFTSVSAAAQPVFQPSASIPVLHGNGSVMMNPWTGGINAAQVSTFNMAGEEAQKDLFVFDRAGNKVLLFEGLFANGIKHFVHRPEFAPLFPALTDWALLRDFDCDGRKDILTYSPLGGSFAAWRNSTTPGGLPQFALQTEMILSLYQFGASQFTTNIYVSTQDIPAIVDFDGDGDLDILTFSVGGTTLEFHENFSVDETGSCGLENFKLRNRCYGQFQEGSDSNDITLGVPCSFNVPNPKSSDRHVGTTILTFDGNSDGLQDIVLGGVSFNNMTFLENSPGAMGPDSIVAFDSAFPSNMGNLAVNVDNFAAGYYEDIDSDGVKDLIVATNSASFAANRRSTWYYKNTGADDLPFFAFQQQDFLQDGTIDLGEYSAVAFFDYNGDGLQDMVVSSRGEFITGGTHQQALGLYVNIGTATSPIFQEVNTNWLAISSQGVGAFPHATFGDVDGDGDSDLVMGDLSGMLHLFINNPDADGIAQMAYQGTITTSAGTTINVGQQSTPQLYDLDGDGLLDLIVGERLGNLNYYRNTGSAAQAQFTLITENLGGVNTTEPTLFIGTSAPHFFVHAGTTYLLAGAESGRVYLYSGIDENILGDYQLESTAAFGVNMGARSRPCVVHINGDLWPDLFVGGIGGGVMLHLGTNPNTTPNLNNGPAGFSVYPNPCADVLYWKHSETTARLPWRITDVQGRVVRSGRENPIQVAHLAPGVYVLSTETSSGRAYAKWIKTEAP